MKVIFSPASSKIPFPTALSSESDLGKSLSLGLSLASCSLVYSILISMHEKHNFSLIKTCKLDPDSNARVTWCYPTPHGVSTLGSGQDPHVGLSGCAGAAWGTAAGGWVGRLTGRLFVQSWQWRTPWSPLFDVLSMYGGALPCCCGAMEWVGDSHGGSPGADEVQAVPCLGAASGMGCSALGLSSLELNRCFLWEEEKAEQVPLDGVHRSFCMRLAV